MNQLPDQRQVVSELKRRLSPVRVRHTLGVSRLAMQLARQHGEDPRRARLAGLLHDWAKEMTAQRLVNYSRRHHLRVPQMSFIQRNAPHLLHAYVSAHMVSKRFGIRDREVLSAVAGHTLGSLQMGVFEKILYVADLSAPDRRFPEARRIRSLARRDLSGAFREALRTKIHYCLRQNEMIHPLALALWNHVCQE